MLPVKVTTWISGSPEVVVPVVLDRVRVRDEPAVPVGVDIGAPSALGELAGVGGLLRSGLRGPAEDVARVDAEQQGEDQDDQAGAAANRDLPATSSSSAAHLRRVELTLVVLHVSPPASNRVPALIGSIVLGRKGDSCEMPRWQSQSAANADLHKVVIPISRPAPPYHHHIRQRGGSGSGTVGDMSVTVADNPMENRYEARVDGELVGISQYEPTSDAIVFLHTVVGEEYEGQGVVRSRVTPRRRASPRIAGTSALPVHQGLAGTAS